MRKTTLYLDRELYGQVRAVLGTRSLRQTVQRAFEDVLANDARRRALQQLRQMDGLDLDQPGVTKSAWRS